MNNKLNIQFNCEYQLTGKLSLTAKLKLLKHSKHDYIRINNGVAYYSNSNSPCAIDLFIDQCNRHMDDSITVIQVDPSNYYLLVIKNKTILTSDIFSQNRTGSKVRLYTINKEFQPTFYTFGYSFEGIDENNIEVIEANPFKQAILKKYRFEKKSMMAKKTKRPIVIGTFAAIAVIAILCGSKISLSHQAKIKLAAQISSQQIIIDQWKDYKDAIFQVTPTEVLPVIFSDLQKITETPGVVVSSVKSDAKSISISLIDEGNSERLIDQQLEDMGFKTNVTGMLFEINKPLSVKASNTYFKDHVVSTHASKTALFDYLSVVGGPVTVKQDRTVVNNNYSSTKLTLSFDNASYDFIIKLFKSINNYPITFNTLDGRSVLTGFTGDISINLIGDKS